MILSSRLRTILLAVSVVLTTGCASTPESDKSKVPPEEAYAQSVEEWHAARIAGLTGEDGWLTLVGLHWLEQGDQTVGRVGDISYAGFSVDEVGTFVRLGDAVGFKSAPGVPVRGVPEDGILEVDIPGPPTVIGIGTCDMYVLYREGRYGVRIRDSAAPLRESFTGVPTFPVNNDFRIRASFTPPPHGETVRINSLAGTEVEEDVAGYASFYYARKIVKLVLLRSGGPGRFFVVFGDATNGTETYDGGRFLDAALGADGQTVILDFNRAYNPPCAFTPFATCPLPPRENLIPFKVTAGEMKWEEAAQRMANGEQG